MPARAAIPPATAAAKIAGSVAMFQESTRALSHPPGQLDGSAWLARVLPIDGMSGSVRHLSDHLDPFEYERHVTGYVVWNRLRQCAQSCESAVTVTRSATNLSAVKSSSMIDEHAAWVEPAL